jgi:thymidylate synthase
MNAADKAYMSLVNRITDFGTHSENRTATDTIKVFGEFLRFHVGIRYPLITQKQVFHRGLHKELFMFLDGETNIESLIKDDVHIWDEWANTNGDLGPVYGAQWRARDDLHLVHSSDSYAQQKMEYLDSLTDIDPEDPKLQGQAPFQRAMLPTGGALYYRKFDQIKNALYRLSKYPDCRRILVDSWNPSVIPVDGKAPSEQPALGKQALPACHTLFQFGSTKSERNVYRSSLSYASLTTQADGTMALFGNPTGLTLKQLTKSRKALVDVFVKHDEIYGSMHFDRQLYLHMHQRSADTFLGFPFNIASYASLLNFVAASQNMLPNTLSISIGDAHVYEDHAVALKLQAKQEEHDAPIFCVIDIQNHPDLRGLTTNNYKIVGYEHGPLITGKPAV